MIGAKVKKRITWLWPRLF